MSNRIEQLALALGLMLLCLAVPAAEAQYEMVWEVRYDGPEILEINSNDYVRDMVVRDGYVYVTGYESQFTAYWATVKYDYTGQELWVRRVVDGQSQTAEALTVDAVGNVYVTGYQYFNSNGDVLTLKYSPDGEVLWEQRYSSPGGNNQPNDMALDASGNTYVAGASWVPAQEDFDLLLLKYDSDGDLLWDRTLDNGDGQLDTGYSLAIDPDGNAIVAGFTEPNAYLVKYSPTGDLLWQDEHVGFSTNDEWRHVETDKDGNIYVLGEISPPGESNHIWTTKYDPDGNILWEQTYTGTADQSCYAGGLELMPDGGVVISGLSWDLPSDNNIVTIRYAPDGTKLWQRLENTGYVAASGQDVAVDADDNIYVTGYGYNYSYWEDIITLGYSPDGDLLWTQIYIGQDYESQSDYPHAIEVDEAANVFVAANSWGENGNDFTTLRYSPVTSAVDPEVTSDVGARLVVHEPWPNPFNPSTTIAYEMPVAGKVQVAIFNTSGRLVRILLDGQREAGFHSLRFDGRDDTGRRLASGIYLVRVAAKGFSAMQKLVLMK
jgi:uncharacterized delta-60 repeat protein